MRLSEMLDLGSKLASDFPFVRVDFIETSEWLYLTELTFGSGGGWEPYDPVSFDLHLGELMNIQRYGNPKYIDAAAP